MRPTQQNPTPKGTPVKTFTITYTVVITTDDDDTSLNHATDSVSQQLWAIDQDYDLQVETATLVSAEELLDSDIRCGNCNVLVADSLHPHYDNLDPRNTLCWECSGGAR